MDSSININCNQIFKNITYETDFRYYTNCKNE